MAGIWDNKKLGEFNELPEKIRLSFDEGSTPFKMVFQEEAPRGILGIKDENKNPNGSFKDRCLAYQVSMHMDKGKDRFVISSSGNAAVSAAAYIDLGGGTLDVFVAESVNLKKLLKLNKIAKTNKNIVIHLDKQAKSAAIQFAREKGVINLRGSHDDLALPGYKTIAYELVYKNFPDIDALFIPCSSGTSALGIMQGLKESGYGHVKVYLCQTGKVHAIAREFDLDFKPSDFSLADAIVDRLAYRKKDILKMLKDNGGGGFVLSDDELVQAKVEANKLGYRFSYNSLLSFAGYNKALAINKKHGLDLPFKMPVILASGL